MQLWIPIHEPWCLNRARSRDCRVCLHKLFGWKSTTCAMGFVKPSDYVIKLLPKFLKKLRQCRRGFVSNMIKATVLPTIKFKEKYQKLNHHDQSWKRQPLDSLVYRCPIYICLDCTFRISYGKMPHTGAPLKACIHQTHQSVDLMDLVVRWRTQVGPWHLHCIFMYENLVTFIIKLSLWHSYHRISSSLHFTYLPWTKWLPFHKRYFQMDFVNGKFWIFIKISLMFVPRGPTENNPALV